MLTMSELEALTSDRNWFGPRSRIIITTRDKHLLDVHEMDALYEAKKSNHKEAVELFSWHVFKHNHPKEDHETLSNSVVQYVNGLPLGLKVLGCFLFGKTICQWESELHKLDQEPNQEIQIVLKRSYDELDYTQKEIFLDIACFFNGEYKDFVTRILDACNFYVESGIQESPKDPGKCSRLCYLEIVYRVLTRKMDDKVKLSKDLEFPSYELRYLYWHGYPLESLPSSFYAEDLVELDMCYSNLKQLWESDMLLEKLNTVRISCSQHLIEIPDFLISALNLEKLILDGCSSLMEVHPSIGRLNKLILLNLKIFKKLRSFRSIIDMKMLEILNFSGCSELKKFPDIQGNMEHLSELYLASAAIEGLPSSIGHLTGLVLLDLKRLFTARQIAKEPWEPARNSSDGIGLHLPSFPYLSFFTNLNLSDCKLMEGAIPDVPESYGNSRSSTMCVQDIDPYNCTSLSASSTGVCTLQCLQFLFYNCSKPVEDESSVSSPTTLAVVMQKFLENIAFSIVFPGSEIPEWMWHEFLEHFPGRITCHLNSDVLGYGKIMKDFGHDLHSKGNNVGSKHVWLGYQPLAQLRLLPFIDPNDLSQIEISFEATNRFSSRASNVVKKCGVRLIYAEDLEGIHPDNIQYSSRVGYDVVKRSSDREGSNGCGRGYSSSSCSYNPPTIPCSSSSANLSKNDYHHPVSSFNKILFC
ncbi:TMV resistance protein N [Vitis vinifera]|uniref:TMV resistance protein N n=1 Tax=Vitis vinifera TaxID=29760 RepID=A0A438HWU4_VITVI|nr:TMV resistance protein N [Vitis vinifera]